MDKFLLFMFLGFFTMVLTSALFAHWEQVEAIRAGLVQQRDEHGRILWVKPATAPPAPKLEK